MFVSSCSGPASHGAGHPTLDVTLSDFRIQVSSAGAPAGTVDLLVHNAAPATHEFVLVRSDLPADQLPIGADGLSVDEEPLTAVDELSEVDTGETDTLTVPLTPGRYVFFCNLEGHYLGGMHGVLVVSADG